MIKQVENKESVRTGWGLRWQNNFEKYARGKQAVLTVSTCPISFMKMQASFVCPFNLTKKILNLSINLFFDLLPPLLSGGGNIYRIVLLKQLK